jgi:hypothetical protein
MQRSLDSDPMKKRALHEEGRAGRSSCPAILDGMMGRIVSYYSTARPRCSTATAGVYRDVLWPVAARKAPSTQEGHNAAGPISRTSTLSLPTARSAEVFVSAAPAANFQADDEGSIPFTRSNGFSHLERQNASHRKMGSAWEPPGSPAGALFAAHGLQRREGGRSARGWPALPDTAAGAAGRVLPLTNDAF